MEICAVLVRAYCRVFGPYAALIAAISETTPRVPTDQDDYLTPPEAYRFDGFSVRQQTLPVRQSRNIEWIERLSPGRRIDVPIPMNSPRWGKLKPAPIPPIAIATP